MKFTFTYFYFLAVIIGLIACHKDGEHSPDFHTENTLYFFTGLVDGENIDLQVTLNGDLLNYHGTGGSVGLNDCILDYSASITDEESDTRPSFGFELLHFYQGDCDMEIEVFNNIFSEGKIDYRAENDLDSSPSVVVTFEKDGISYSSLYGAQTNSIFEIEQSIEDNNIFGKHQLLEGNIDCMLYDVEGSGASIALVDGAFKLNVAAYGN